MTLYGMIVIYVTDRGPAAIIIESLDIRLMADYDRNSQGQGAGAGRISRRPVAGIPVAGGIYIIHVKTDVGEKVLKWFGMLRPPDLNTF